jgi:hypothetical protein
VLASSFASLLPYSSRQQPQAHSQSSHPLQQLFWVSQHDILGWVQHAMAQQDSGATAACWGWPMVAIPATARVAAIAMMMVFILFLSPCEDLSGRSWRAVARPEGTRGPCGRMEIRR